MKNPGFYKLKPGELMKLPMKDDLCRWDIKCCDCGLEHSLLMKATKTKLLVRVWRTDCVGQMKLPKGHSHK